ncbi:MAG: hypothetical protein FWD66_02990 [Paludibacter sp.]|nr:hypothetical protein [Paludibacter sp.]
MENIMFPTILACRAFIVNVLTNKICRLKLYSIDMQALTGYRLSKTQVISFRLENGKSSIST